jgi:hypothetical protein
VADEVQHLRRRADSFAAGLLVEAVVGGSPGVCEALAAAEAVQQARFAAARKAQLASICQVSAGSSISPRPSVREAVASSVIGPNIASLSHQPRAPGGNQTSVPGVTVPPQPLRPPQLSITDLDPEDVIMQCECTVIATHVACMPIVYAQMRRRQRDRHCRMRPGIQASMRAYHGNKNAV